METKEKMIKMEGKTKTAFLLFASWRLTQMYSSLTKSYCSIEKALCKLHVNWNTEILTDSQRKKATLLYERYRAVVITDEFKQGTNKHQLMTIVFNCLIEVKLDLIDSGKRYERRVAEIDDVINFIVRYNFCNISEYDAEKGLDKSYLLIGKGEK